jgi:MoaA/NifB/PqqE/SkfB family radical SAM enzyme
MSLFKLFKTKKSKEPHEIFPEIMHWEKGDRLHDKYNCGREYIGINKDGTVLIQNYGDVDVLSIHEIKRDYTNITLLKDRCNPKSDKSDGYMQLLSDFQKAYKEISQ